jgi:hypothetical protein
LQQAYSDVIHGKNPKYYDWLDYVYQDEMEANKAV